MVAPFAPGSVWEQMQQAGQSAIGGRYGSMRQGVQTGMTSRGAGRSGFLGSELVKLEGQEQMEKAALDADISAKKQEFEQRQAELALAQQQARHAKRRSKRRRKFGTFAKILGAAAPIVGGIFGGPVGAMAGAAAGGAISGYEG